MRSQCDCNGGSRKSVLRRGPLRANCSKPGRKKTAGPLAIVPRIEPSFCLARSVSLFSRLSKSSGTFAGFFAAVWFSFLRRFFFGSRRAFDFAYDAIALGRLPSYLVIDRSFHLPGILLAACCVAWDWFGKGSTGEKWYW